MNRETGILLTELVFGGWKTAVFSPLQMQNQTWL